jgi:trimeric autotransporter adhesin
MNKKKVTCSALAALMIAGTTTFPAFAEIPGKTVVIGDKAFNLDFARDEDNFKEMSEAVKNGGEIYIKLPTGMWFKNDGAPVEASVIPAVTYKDAEGTKEFKKGDGDEVGQGEFKVVEISAKDAKTVTVNFNKPVEDTGKLDLKIKRNGINLTVAKTSYNEDKTSVELELSYKLKDGKYVAEAKYDEGEVTKAEAELKEAKLSNIEIVGDRAVLGETTVINDTVKVRVKFLDQYGNKINVNSSDLTLSPQSGTPTYIKADGAIKVVDNRTFRINDPFVLTVVHKDGIVATKTLTVSQPAMVESIELGEVRIDNDDYKDKPVRVADLVKFSDTDVEKGYYIPLIAKDQYDNIITADELENITILPGLNDGRVVDIHRQTTGSGDSLEVTKQVFEDKDGNPIIRIKAAADLDRGGKEVITVVCPNGKSANLTVDILDDAKIDVLEIEEPSDLIKVNANIELPFTAVDQYGKELIKSSDIKFKEAEDEQEKEKLEFTNGGYIQVTGGKLIAKTDYKNDEKRIIELKPTSKVVFLQWMTGTNKVKTMTLNAEEEAMPQNISGIDKDFKALIQNGIESKLAKGDILLKDQYNEDVDLKGDYDLFLKHDGDMTSMDVKVKVGEDADENALYGALAFNSDNEAEITDNLKFVAHASETGTETFTVVLKHYKEENNVKTYDNESTSEFSFSVKVVSESDIEKFDVELDSDIIYTGASDYRRAAHDNAYTVVGLIDKKKVAVDQDLAISASISASKLTTTEGSITLNKKSDAADAEYDAIDTDGKDKTVKLTVVMKKGAPIVKDIKINNAAPVGQELVIKKGSKVYSDPVIVLPKNEVSGKDFGGARAEDTEAAIKFQVKDQYGVELEEYCTYAVTDIKDKNVVENQAFSAAIDTTTGVVTLANQESGDSFVIVAVTKNGTVKRIKVILGQAAATN